MTWPGSPPALIGFSAQDAASSLILPTSLTARVLDVTETGNTGVNGRWLFKIDSSEIEMPGESHVLHACILQLAGCERVLLL